jgi:hypothetical protein
MADTGQTDELVSRRYSSDDAKQNAQLIFRVMGKDDYTLKELREAVENKKVELSDDDIRILISHSFAMRNKCDLVGSLYSYERTNNYLKSKSPRLLHALERNILKKLWFYLEYFDLEGPDAERVRDLLVEKFPDKAGCIRVASDLGPKFAAKLD